MKKFMILASVIAMVVAALALPVLAQDRFSSGDPRNDDQRQAERFADFWDDFFSSAENNDRWDNNDWWDNDDWWNDRNDDFDNDTAPVVNQDFDQQAQSGDVKQSFNVSNTGDNSNQCAGIQGVANTGNAQNQVGVIQYGSEADDFSFEDVGSTITVSPSNSTLCEQRVDQAASASG